MSFGTFWWKPDRLESFIPIKSWLMSDWACIWLIDFRVVLFYSLEQHLKTKALKQAGEIPMTTTGITLVHRCWICSISFTQSSPLDSPLNRVSQRGGHLQQYLKEVRKELLFSHQNWGLTNCAERTSEGSIKILGIDLFTEHTLKFQKISITLQRGDALKDCTFLDNETLTSWSICSQTTSQEVFCLKLKGLNWNIHYNLL